jgi:hypothetical protein
MRVPTGAGDDPGAVEDAQAGRDVRRLGGALPAQGRRGVRDDVEVEQRHRGHGSALRVRPPRLGGAHRRRAAALGDDRVLELRRAPRGHGRKDPLVGGLLAAGGRAPRLLPEGDVGLRVRGAGSVEHGGEQRSTVVGVVGVRADPPVGGACEARQRREARRRRPATERDVALARERHREPACRQRDGRRARARTGGGKLRRGEQRRAGRRHRKLVDREPTAEPAAAVANRQPLRGSGLAAQGRPHALEHRPTLAARTPVAGRQHSIRPGP